MARDGETRKKQETDETNQKSPPNSNISHCDTEDEDEVDYGSIAENFRGLNDAQINQLSKKGIAKW